MFFVLNPGRSGSRTVATVLSQSPNCTCLHEPYPQLIAEAARYRYGELEARELVAVLRRTRSANEGEVYGECANRLAYLVPVLREAFPAAQYVHMVRDGRNFVSSAAQRGWYGTEEKDPADGQLSEWQQWRIQADRVGVLKPSDWSAMDQFERICWLWTYTNQLLTDDLTGADSMLLPIEDLAEELPVLCDHLRIQPTDFSLVRSNRRRTADDPEGLDPRKTNMVERLFTWHDWSNEQREVFDELCGAAMDKYYPLWRSSEVQEQDKRPHTPSPAALTGTSTRTSSGLPSDLYRRLGGIETSLDGLQARIAEVGLLRQEHRTLLEEYQRSLERAEQSERQRDETERQRDEAERQRDEAERRCQGLGANVLSLESRLEAVDQELDRERALVATRTQELKDRTRQLRVIRRSRTYRAGLLIARVATAPRRIGKRTVQGIWRVLLPDQRARLVAFLGRLSKQENGNTPQLAPSTPVVPRPVMSVSTAGSHSAPPVLVVLLGAAERDLHTALTQLEHLESGAEKDVVVVTDCDAFHIFRRNPLPFEYVPPRVDWELLSSDRSYDDFVAARLKSIAEIYRVGGVVIAQDGDTGLSFAASMAASLH